MFVKKESNPENDESEPTTGTGTEKSGGNQFIVPTGVLNLDLDLD